MTNEPDEPDEPEMDDSSWLQWASQEPVELEVSRVLRANPGTTIRHLAAKVWIDVEDPDNKMLVAILQLAPCPLETLRGFIEEGMAWLVTASPSLVFFAIPKELDDQLLLAARIGAASLIGRTRMDGNAPANDDNDGRRA